MTGFLIGIILSFIYIYPIFQGLVLLPLDLLVSNSAPWLLANQILIKNSYMLDSVIQMYPWHHLTFASLTQGIIPLWNPYQFTGLPFMAGMKPMVFYPFNFLFFLGEIPSWNMLLYFQLFLAFYFCYLLMRKLRISIWGSLLSSIAFAFSSLMIGFLQFGSDGHTLVWLPFLCYCTYTYIEGKKAQYLVGLGLGIAFAIFAGHLQMVAYECCLVVALILYFFYIKKISWRDVLVLFFTMALGFGLAAIQLLPSIELFWESARGLGYSRNLFEEGLLRPYELLRIFSPDMFGHPATGDLHIGYIESSGYFGIIPLFFAIFSCTEWRTNRMVRFFGIACVISSIFSLWPFGLLFLFLKIPLITSGLGERLFFLTLFSGAVLSGYGLDIFIKSKEYKKIFRWILIYVGAVLFIYTGAFLTSKYVTFFGATFINLKFSFAILLSFFIINLFYKLTRKKYSIAVWFYIICIIGLSYFDVFRMGYRFLTFSNSKFMYPDIPVIQYVRDNSDKTLGRVYGLTGSEAPSFLRIYSIETYNPLYTMRTGRVLKALEGKEGDDFPTNIYRFAYSERLKYVFDVLGVYYVATGNGEDPAISYLHSQTFQKDFTKIYTDERHDVYENKEAHRRFGLFYQVKSGLSERRILDDIKNQKTDLRNTLLLEEPFNQELSIGTGSSQLIASDVNNQTFLVRTDKTALFYISDAYYPGWIATVNGNKTHIYRANYNFRAIVVPKGESQVIFSYKPRSYTLGKYISIGSCLFLGLFGIIIHTMNHRVSRVKNDKKFRKKI